MTDNQDVVFGLNGIVGAGLMESIEWFFNLVGFRQLSYNTDVSARQG